jgi:protein-S-isoprenylcysteine O-methyltransferase Ste14
VRQPFLHLPVPWVFLLGFLVGVGLQLAVPVGLTSSSASTVLPIAGGIVFLVGSALAGWSWWIFHRVGTTAVPGEASRVLVTHGPYRLTRNPMYVGLTLAYLGEAGLLLLAWPLLLLPFVLAYVNWFVIPVEEGNLSEFEGYRAYRARVRRWL